MRARRLIEQQDFLGPDGLVAVTAAFEDAWQSIQHAYRDDDGREAARLRLATIVIDLARHGASSEHLAAMALEIMARPYN